MCSSSFVIAGQFSLLASEILPTPNKVKDLSSEPGRKEMEISSWYPSLPFTLCDHSVSSILEQKKRC
jgi:hypothetical protein